MKSEASDADSLYALVTGAIWRAERLDEEASGASFAAWEEVSRLEERLAAILPAVQPEGIIARRGAVRAAIKAGDVGRAQALVERFTAEEGAPSGLRRNLHQILLSGTRAAGEHAEADATITPFKAGEPAAIAQLQGWISHAASTFRPRLGEQYEVVLQQVSVEIERCLTQGSVRDEMDLRKLIWRVTARTCLERLRAPRRLSFAQAERRDVAGPNVSHRRASFAQDPNLLMRILALTGEECQRLWSMVVDGRSPREMSEQTGLSEKTVRMRVMRCRQRAEEVSHELLSRPHDFLYDFEPDR